MDKAQGMKRELYLQITMSCYWKLFSFKFDSLSFAESVLSK